MTRSLLAALVIIALIGYSACDELKSPEYVYNPPPVEALGLSIGENVAFFDNFDNVAKSAATWVQSSQPDINGPALLVKIN